MSSPFDSHVQDERDAAAFRRAGLRSAFENDPKTNHFASLYETRDEQLAVAIPFVEVGLERNEQTVYITHRNTPDQIRAELAEAGVDVDRREDDDQLHVLAATETYIDGSFDPQEMIEFLRACVERSREGGFSGLRIAGEMGWVLDTDVPFEDLLRYEHRYECLADGIACVALCQYDRTAFPARAIVDLVQTHPKIIYRNRICENPYYMPTEEFLGADRPDMEAERMLATTYDLAAAKSALRQREQRLQVLHRVLRHNLRNDLNVILSHTELIEDATSEPRVRESVGTIVETVQRMLSIAEDVKHVDESLGASPPDLGRHNLGSLLASVVADLPPEVAETVTVSVADDLWVGGCADLTFAFRTLIETVRNFAEGVTVTAEPTDQGAYLHTDVRIAPEDGAVPSGEIEALIEGTETPLKHSSGVELWLVNWLVELSDGEVDFQRDGDGSTTIVVSLPSMSRPVPTER